MSTHDSAAHPPAFELRGEFTGFFRDFLGKRRMCLRVEEQEVYLKVPKGLRHELEDLLVRGQQIVVTGHEVAAHSGRVTRAVAQVRLADSDACVRCPIRICAKKNCWRNGGKILWHTLETQIAEAGLEKSVKLQATGCMDRCKQAPNAECGGKEYRRCTPETASEILAPWLEALNSAKSKRSPLIASPGPHP